MSVTRPNRRPEQGSRSDTPPLSITEDPVDAVKARPLAATGVVAAITMFLAREPLMDLAGSMFNAGKEKRKKRRTRKTSAQKNETERVE